MKQMQHIEDAMSKQSLQVKEEYQIHQIFILDCIQFLLNQGLAFHGNDESTSSRNKGNFLELIDFLANDNETFVKFGRILVEISSSQLLQFKRILLKLLLLKILEQNIFNIIFKSFE